MDLLLFYIIMQTYLVYCEYTINDACRKNDNFCSKNIYYQFMVNMDKDLNLLRILNKFKGNMGKMGVQAYIILAQQIKQQIWHSLTSFLLAWQRNICISILLYILLGQYQLPYLLTPDNTALENRNLLQNATKCILIYGLCWVIVMTIHSRYYNNYAKILSIQSHDSYKRIVIFNMVIFFIYELESWIPVNHYANGFIGGIVLYVLIIQQYIRKCFLFNISAVRIRKIGFVNTFSANQLISLSMIVTSLLSVIFPVWSEYIRYLLLVPLLFRMSLSILIGTTQEYFNCVKLTMISTITYFTIINEPSFYLRLATSIYSYYCDIFRDWKVHILFAKDSKYKVKLPIAYFVVGVVATLVGRFIWLFFPIRTTQKIIIELTRRSLWNLLRIEREIVFQRKKEEKLQ